MDVRATEELLKSTQLSPSYSNNSSLWRLRDPRLEELRKQGSPTFGGIPTIPPPPMLQTRIRSFRTRLLKRCTLQLSPVKGFPEYLHFLDLEDNEYRIESIIALMHLGRRKIRVWFRLNGVAYECFLPGFLQNLFNDGVIEEIKKRRAVFTKRGSRIIWKIEKARNN